MSILDDLESTVSLSEGTVARAIYSDQEVFDAEIERIYGRSWLFLCHDSQLKEPGDFFEAVMGKDNVLVVRQKDGSVAAFLNSCTHRGNAVCRAEEGNARSFLCTYHGWSFGIDGRLKGVPGYKDLYHSDFEKSCYDLVRIAQLDNYRGFWLALTMQRRQHFTIFLVKRVAWVSTRSRRVATWKSSPAFKNSLSSAIGNSPKTMASTGTTRR